MFQNHNKYEGKTPLVSFSFKLSFNKLFRFKLNQANSYEFTRANETTKTLNSFTSNISIDEINDSSIFVYC